MNKEKILVIDDEAGIRSSLKGILEDEDYAIKTAETAEEALELLRKQDFGLILLDIWLPGMNGIELLKKIKAMNENSQVVMISGHGTIETAVTATKLGAYDFLEKPLSLEKVILTVKNALRQKKLEEENIQLQEKIRAKYHLIGKSPAIQKIREKIKRVAPTSSPVLIYGENGTGKELVARLIHLESPRKEQRFIPINFAGIPEDLVKNELFGYAKGSSAHALKDKKGKLLMANRGTLYFEEIDQMSLEVQAKLARVIEEQRFNPPGSAEFIPVDIRIIAATDKNLRESVAEGKFREDLFSKLNVIPIAIPPLRERKEDIPILVNHFLKHFSIENGKKKKSMSSQAMKAFVNYSWPRNISELINVIERFVIIVQDEEIKASHLLLLVESREPQSMPRPAGHQSLKQVRTQFEREYIHRALIKHKWDLQETASELKIEKSMLNKKIKSLGLTFLG
jgi:two-component system nitrogen regulation response regulator NtrX